MFEKCLLGKSQAKPLHHHSMLQSSPGIVCAHLETSVWEPRQGFMQSLTSSRIYKLKYLLIKIQREIVSIYYGVRCLWQDTLCFASEPTNSDGKRKAQGWSASELPIVVTTEVMFYKGQHPVKSFPIKVISPATCPPDRRIPPMPL